MKNLLIIASAIFICITAFASTASALTQEEFFAQLDRLFQDCSDSKITIDQWKSQFNQVNDLALKEGIINPQMYAQIAESRDKSERIIRYNREADQRLQSCKRSEITLNDFEKEQTSALRSIFNEGAITQEQYQEGERNLNQNLKECAESQKANQPQEAPQAQSQQSLTQEQIAKLKEKQDKLLLQLREIFEKCQNLKLSPDELDKQYNAILTDALQQGTISQDDFTQNHAQIPEIKAHCNALQNFAQHVDACAKAHGPTQNYRQCAETEVDKLIALGYATQADKDEFMQNADQAIAQASAMNKTNSGRELNPNRESLLPDYRKMLIDITDDAYEGLYGDETYHERAMAVLNEADRRALLTKTEYEVTRTAIRYYQSYLESLGQVLVGDYKLIDFTCSGNTCTSTQERIGEHVESRLLRQREGLEITVGLNGGMIWDDASKSSPVTYHELNMGEFWSGRNFKGVDKLWMAGFYLSFGYTLLGWLNLYIQQEFDAGKWLGDAGNTYQFSQILGYTFFGARFLLPFWGTRFQLGFNLGMGMAYSNGDKRNNFLSPDYIPAYIFDDDLNKGVAFAAKFGVSFDFFITPNIAIGFKVDYNFVSNEMSDNVFHKDFGYQEMSFLHIIHFLQPGIQLTWTIPTLAYYSTYRRDTLANPLNYKDRSPYPAPFDTKE